MRFAYAIFLIAAGLCYAGPERLSELSFKDLNGISHRPLDPGDKQASVLIFYGQDCPVSNAYAPELNRIAASRTNFSFYIVQVDPELTPAAAMQHIRQYDLHPPVLLDPKHDLVKATGAKVTPEAVVVAKSGKVVYHGRIDNRYAALGKKRSTATQHDLLDALDDLAAGRPVRTSQTKAIGCSIE